MTADAICPELGPGGRRCRRWNQPAAHSDGWHESDAYRWAHRRPPLQLHLDLDAAAERAAPALKEAAP